MWELLEADQAYEGGLGTDQGLCVRSREGFIRPDSDPILWEGGFGMGSGRKAAQTGAGE